ncbi:pesticin C-terminus-like muramidase [Methylobacter sp. Wu1]|uniref:pesticin C-terminus-like muramidase n=1 Tax=Methylobacter sp. Wu1 TaxID=3119359 RepID=UPI002F921462
MARSRRSRRRLPQPLTEEERQNLQPVAVEWQERLSTMTPAEQAEVLLTANRIRPGMISDGVYQPCPDEKRPSKLNCVTATVKMGISEAAKQKILDDAQAETGVTMRADIDKLLGWEENYGGAYVPWAPAFERRSVDLGTRSINVLQPSTARDRGSLSGWRVGESLNRSGVTVAAGVDLGQKSEREINELVDGGVSGAGLLDAEQAQALKDKLKPYAGKTRAEACQYLRMHPLTLSQNEVDTLNYSSIKSKLKEASRQYDRRRDLVNGVAFSELDSVEQTTVFSKVYHTGQIQEELAKAISIRDQNEIFTRLRERDREYPYLRAHFNAGNLLTEDTLLQGNNP